MLDDLLVGVAMVLTLGFGVAALLGNDAVAAWCAFGLAVFGVIRLCGIIFNAISPRY